MANPTTGRREITLIQERSSGTFARVHLARATDSGGLSRIVAVKVLKERWTETADILARTRDEAQLLASLQHQNIVRVDAITEIDGLPAIIMEFVHGIDLGQLLKSTEQLNQPIPHRAIYEIAEYIASALAAAWFKVPIGMAEPLRVVHRDIKPSNVMISTEGELRVLDFGTARFEDSSRIARTEAFRFGSLKYMSPERRDGARGEHPADMYSLGLVIIELLSGRMHQPLPLGPGVHDEAITKLIDAIPDFGLPNSGWDNSLRETLCRLCASDPANRLDARQAVKLMRAFKQQAHGDGLIAYAEMVVAPITASINAIPDMVEEDTEDGTRFSIDSDGKTSVLRRSSDLGAAGIADDLETQVSRQVESTAVNPQASSALAMTAKDTLPLDDDHTQPDLRSPRQNHDLRPGYAMSDGAATGHSISEMDTLQEAHPSSWNPKVSSRPTKPGPKQTPGSAKRLPPPVPAGQADRIGYLVAGCSITVIGLLGLLIGLSLFFLSKDKSGTSWLTFGQDGQPAQSTASSTQPANVPAEENLGDLIEVSLHAGDPTVQWIRLFNADGRRLLTAKPDGTASIPPGEYELAIKVVARNVLKKQIDLNSNTSLTCKPTTMGRVRCVDPRGGSELLLRP